jgi:hypothetical protein
VPETLNGMTSEELTEWRAYDRLAPLDWAWRLEWMLAQLCCLFANAHRNPRGSPCRFEEFTPPWWKRGEPPKQDAAANWKRLDATFRMMAGKPRRKG